MPKVENDLLKLDLFKIKKEKNEELKFSENKIFEGKEKKHVGFENGPGRLAMQNGVMHAGPGSKMLSCINRKKSLIDQSHYSGEDRPSIRRTLLLSPVLQKTNLYTSSSLLGGSQT